MSLRQFVLRRTPALWLGSLAALLYSSWPLGFMLNPAVSRHALASQLQAPHQPYNWLFVLLDVLTGMLVAAAGWLQWRTSKHATVMVTAICAYVLFGVCAAGAALVPLGCDPQSQVQACGPVLRSPSIMAHGAMSILSVISLLVGLILVAKAIYQSRASRHVQNLFVAIVLCWIGFGLGSLIELLLRIRNNNLLQDFFITVCSLSIAVVIGGMEYLARHAGRKQLSPIPGQAQNSSFQAGVY